MFLFISNFFVIENVKACNRLIILPRLCGFTNHISMQVNTNGHARIHRLTGRNRHGIDQRAINQETQQVNTGYFESQTRYEEVLSPYTPVMTP